MPKMIPEYDCTDCVYDPESKRYTCLVYNNGVYFCNQSEIEANRRQGVIDCPVIAQDMI